MSFVPTHMTSLMPADSGAEAQQGSPVRYTYTTLCSTCKGALQCHGGKGIKLLPLSSIRHNSYCYLMSPCADRRWLLLFSRTYHATITAAFHAHVALDQDRHLCSQISFSSSSFLQCSVVAPSRFPIICSSSAPMLHLYNNNKQVSKTSLAM